MAEFTYTGIDKSGKTVRGTLVAANEGELRMQLRAQGVRPKKIQTLGKSVVNLAGSLFQSGGAISVPLEIIITFSRQLQVMIGAGVPLVQSMELLSEQTPHKGMRDVIFAVKEKVQGGTFLWESLAAFPKVFPKLYVALIRAGESSGSLDQMLKRICRYLEDADRLRKLLKSASMYPIIVISIGIGVVTLMLVFVIPKFEELLKGSGQSLPGPTQFVIDLSHALVNNIHFILIGGAAAIFFLLRFFKSDEGRAFLDRVTFNLPLFGELARKGGVARFTRTLSTLLASGVNLIDAIDICKSTIDNVVLEAAVAKIRSEIEGGRTLGQVVNQITVFPKMAVQMISVGENTGSLDKMLEKVADFYEAEVETLVGGLTKLIEPLVLVFLGGAVGGLMIAMYLPIFKMAGGAE
jgi:type IV pilus assembly protein PilC